MVDFKYVVYGHKDYVHNHYRTDDWLLYKG